MAEETTGTSIDPSGVTITKRFADSMRIKKGMRARINRRRVHVSFHDQIKQIIKRGAL